jgi:hypothetical protein
MMYSEKFGGLESLPRGKRLIASVLRAPMSSAMSGEPSGNVRATGMACSLFHVALERRISEEHLLLARPGANGPATGVTDRSLAPGQSGHRAPVERQQEIE